MKVKIFLFLAIATFISGSRKLYSQAHLERYIAEALENNLVIKDKKISLGKSLLALKEAGSLFLPITSLDAQYLLANGGRSIDIPVGTLMNPVYSTLNQLTNSQKFPEIQNVSEQLNPNNFYDVRIRTVMPIVNPDLKINREIKREQVSLQELEIEIYKRQLVKDVKSAYFNYLAATKSIDIYKSALEVVNQNLKVNRALLQHGKGLPAYVSRAETEVTKVEIAMRNAINTQQNAQSYFNFLLNKPLSELIESSPADDVPDHHSDTTRNISEREEIKSLATLHQINNQSLKMNRAFRTPRLNAFLDVGSQGFDFNVNDNTLFYMVGLQVKVPIFTGKSNLYKIKQTEFDAESIATKKEYTIKQLELAAAISRNDLSNTRNEYLALLKQEESSRKYFQLINRGFQEGVNSFIEFLDARNQLTTVQLQLNIQKFKVLTALADYERQTASYSFKN